MTALKNPNHPKRGDSITVEPIRRPTDIQAISRLLKDSPRDRLLFLMGINNGLRTGDLLKLKADDVRLMKVGDRLTIKEGKTGKMNVLVINKTVHRAMREYIAWRQPGIGEYLFKSRKGENRPLTVQAVNRLVKSWCKAVNLKGNYGAHTLRKTFGYVQRTVHGVGFELIAKRFNHSNPAVTMRYLGIEDKEIHGILMNEIG
jgi:integrase